VATRSALATWRQRKPTVPELSVPLYELCTMLKAGVPLVDAVAAQGQSAHHPQVTAAFAGMAQALRRGQSFADALGNSGLQLPLYIQQLVRAGELTGRMGEALSGGVAQMEYEHRLRSEMRNALIYPTILVLAGVGAVLVMFAFVVPKFSMLLHKSSQLPWLGWAVLALIAVMEFMGYMFIRKITDIDV
jgi:general secretion pathway protein F